jgi:DNA-binding transcriptional ArsR family regulator
VSKSRRFVLAGAFKALGDSTRMDILALLRKRGVCTAGEIARAFPSISRPAVSRHVRVLKEAVLILVEGVGRERRYRLNAPALARLQHEWFGQFGAGLAGSLDSLKARVEQDAQFNVPAADKARRVL